MWPLHPPTPPVLHAWNAASLLPSPDIQVATSASASISACWHSLSLRIKFVVQKKRLPGHRTNFQKSFDRNQSFLPGL